MVTYPSIIFHDQEPLYYNLYSQQDFVDCMKSSKIINQTVKESDLLSVFSKMHLRACTLPYNLHEYTLLCHSEKNSKELELYENNKFIGVYYWSHALISRDWFRFAEHDTGLNVKFENLRYDFLIYNRAWSGSREYRLKFCELLAQQDLLPNCKTSFSATDGNTHYTKHQFKNQTFKIGSLDLEKLFEPNLTVATSSADYTSSDYASCAIEVVLETIFDDTRHHLTEKTLRAIACKKPFLLVATPGTLSYLRSYGFETFQGLICEDYDNIQDSADRLTAIVNELKRISLLCPDEKIKLWQQLYAIAERNQKRFFSQEFFDVIVGEYQKNLHTALERCKTSLTDKWWNMLLDRMPLPRGDTYYRVAEWCNQNFKSVRDF